LASAARTEWISKVARWNELSWYGACIERGSRSKSRRD
jgi:hypothetical protein